MSPADDRGRDHSNSAMINLLITAQRTQLPYNGHLFHRTHESMGAYYVNFNFTFKLGPKLGFDIIVYTNVY